MSYVLLDLNGEQVTPGIPVFSILGSRLYLVGYNNRSVFVSRDPDDPPLHAQAFSPDVFGLRIEERGLI